MPDHPAFHEHKQASKEKTRADWCKLASLGREDVAECPQIIRDKLNGQPESSFIEFHGCHRGQGLRAYFRVCSLHAAE